MDKRSAREYAEVARALKTLREKLDAGLRVEQELRELLPKVQRVLGELVSALPADGKELITAALAHTLLDPKHLWERFVEGQDSEEGIWASFLRSDIAAGATPAELELVQTRKPVEEREPSLALYEGLLLLHRGALTREEFDASIDHAEQLDRQIRAKLLRGTFKLVP